MGVNIEFSAESNQFEKKIKSGTKSTQTCLGKMGYIH